ncbi:glycosyltransferase [Gammaproteobacteria bacterium]|nr:glycosyltransferase [Gammaproteobacteria bacterium]
MNPQFSIIVPTLDNFLHVQELIFSINSQTLLPREIIIADSSSSNEIEDGLKIIATTVPIIYLRVGRAYVFDRFLKYFSSLPIFSGIFKTQYSVGRAFPYEATNAGAEVASFEWLAFLDASTIPTHTWLEDYWSFRCSNQCDVVFGNTKYFAETNFQKILRASTYGRKGHETAPGSIIKKVHFLRGHRILEGVRSGGDVAWKQDIKKSYKWFLPSEPYLKYSNLPKRVFPTLKKFFIYQIYGSFVDIQHNAKDMYLGLTLLLSIIIVPKWNYIVGWDSVLFIPHITKVFFICILLTFAITFFINRAILRKYSRGSLSANLLKVIVFAIIAYGIFRWNDVVASWVEDSIWYVPNITKIFVLSVVLASFLYRGIYFPIKNKIELNYLFPFNWIFVGFLGIALDIVKAPGYLLGAILATFLRSRTHKNRST